MYKNLRNSSAAFLAAIFGACLASAQPAPSTPANGPGQAWHSDQVVYVAGLDGLKQNAPGSLKIIPGDLVFSTRDAHQEIPLSEITSASIGDERVATGGTSAKVARKVFIFGFGAAAGAVTSKTVDVLTIEYQDGRSGYHGAVFEVPKGQGEIAQQQLTAFASTPHSPSAPLDENSARDCSEAVHSRTLLVTPVDDSGLHLPVEYRVLLYEQLVAELQKSYAAGTILRVGDEAAVCPSATLHVSVSAFKKGNEKLRSSTGPVGLFVGGTSVTFSASLTDRAGKVVYEKSLKSSKHGDSDSLGVAHDVAQSVSKRLAKSKAAGFNAAA